MHGIKASNDHHAPPIQSLDFIHFHAGRFLKPHDQERPPLRVFSTFVMFAHPHHFDSCSACACIHVHHDQRKIARHAILTILTTNMAYVLNITTTCNTHNTLHAQHRARTQCAQRAHRAQITRTLRQQRTRSQLQDIDNPKFPSIERNHAALP